MTLSFLSAFDASTEAGDGDDGGGGDDDAGGSGNEQPCNFCCISIGSNTSVK